MEIKEYLDKIKDIESSILQYINQTSNIEENYHNLINLFETYKIKDDRNELKLILHLLSIIANEHHRLTGFMDKIFQIITDLKDDIKRYYSNIEIFNIFEQNKRILLFLIENKIIKIDNNIASLFLSSKYSENKYPQYFYPELKPFLNNRKSEEIFNELQKEVDLKIKNEDKLIATIDQKRRIGENDEDICKIIREDSIEDFIKFIEKNDLINMDFEYKIKESIFETNSFLLSKQVQLIDYCAFFGSEQIFNHIHSIIKKIDQSTWIFAVHSQNEKLFKKIKKKSNDAKDSDFIKSLILESIKCHHNLITNYLQSNFVNKKMSFDFSKSFIEYYNFSNIQPELINQTTFFDLVQYDYTNIVRLLLKNNNIDVNMEIVF